MPSIAKSTNLSGQPLRGSAVILFLMALLAAFSAVAQSGPGVLGRSDTTSAVRGEAGNITGIAEPIGTVGVVGIGSNRGTYGSSSAGIGLFGVSSSNYGVWGSSEQWRGVTGRTGRADNNYGFYTPDNLFALNMTTAGSMTQVARNSGVAPLVPGDVVVFDGISQPLRPGEPPVLLVSRASASGSTAVAGVVLGRFNIEVINAALDEADRMTGGDQIEITPAGPVATEEYLLVVVRGPAQVNVAGLPGGIKPGDLLSSSAAPGLAQRSELVSVSGIEIAPPGTVLGKALEYAAPNEQTSIYVYVTL